MEVLNLYFTYNKIVTESFHLLTIYIIASRDRGADSMSYSCTYHMPAAFNRGAESFLSQYITAAVDGAGSFLTYHI